tara:strand:- start:816 stop:1073 length:258 start_codon:yes stop_codon:yes gene_type:complete
MKSKKHYVKNDKVYVKSFGVPNVCVILKKRYIAANSESKLGVDGWEAQIINKREVNKLRDYGVPYKQGEKPIVFVADWQIIKKCR